MKILVALFAVLAVSSARVVITAEGQDTPHLLGAKACTWGPSYWCQNITTASGCGTTSRCIKDVWEHLQVPEDNDSVCGICKDMVKQARDQLESNQTQEDLKAVFEGSCALIYLKPIVEECDRLVDQFIPELVETLASQMNPSVVCSVAGLCNNPRIDQLLLENKNKDKVALGDDQVEPDDCSKCYTIATHMEDKLNHTSKDQMVQRMLLLCGHAGSFSDGCSAVVLTYFDEIYRHLQENFRAESICHLSGKCVAAFHKHEGEKALNVEIRPLSSVGLVEVSDDLPCKLCEQLVSHLRDLLVANTTEAEFQQVLEGFCRQTKSFATECKSIVDEYYPEIYAYLTRGLNGNFVCEMAGICPQPDKAAISAPIWPLLPEKAVEKVKEVMKSNPNPKLSEAEEMQLPIERMVNPVSMLAFPQMDVQGKETCAFCEYLMHYLQQAITDPTNEEKLKEIVGKVCDKLPESVENNCREFLDTYGDAVVAILAQEIDPSQVCPMIHVCPSQQLMEFFDKLPRDMVLLHEQKDKPTCPLCLLAVSQLYNAIKDNRTEAAIEAELDKLCLHLPKDLNEQCTDFVKGYSKELVEMLLADLSPQEICVYIKLCIPNSRVLPTNFYPMDKDGEILTNEIPDFPLHQEKIAYGDNKCVVCEFVMQYVDKAISNKKTKDEIEKIVHGVCNYLPKTVSRDCNQFVDEYADVVIELLSNEVTPKEVCTMIGLCQANSRVVQDSIAECALAESVVSSINELLQTANPSIEEAISKACSRLPASRQNKCDMMMEIYEQSFINLFRAKVPAGEATRKLGLCPNTTYGVDLKEMTRSGTHLSQRAKRSDGPDQFGTKKCTWGPSYWCSSDASAAECGTAEHCRANVWKAESAAAAKQKAQN